MFDNSFSTTLWSRCCFCEMHSRCTYLIMVTQPCTRFCSSARYNVPPSLCSPAIHNRYQSNHLAWDNAPRPPSPPPPIQPSKIVQTNLPIREGFAQVLIAAKTSPFGWCAFQGERGAWRGEIGWPRAGFWGGRRRTTILWLFSRNFLLKIV